MIAAGTAAGSSAGQRCAREREESMSGLTLRKEIESAINRNSAESGSDTSYFILAQFLVDCLTAFDAAAVAREDWYGRKRQSGPLAVDAPTPEAPR